MNGVADVSSPYIYTISGRDVIRDLGKKVAAVVDDLVVADALDLAAFEGGEGVFGSSWMFGDICIRLVI